MNAKKILDAYATEVLSTDAIYIQKDKAGIDANKAFSYNPDKYSESICLWKAPNNWIRIEFDAVTLKEVKTLISETESNIKALGFDYCITYHNNGVSPYINICNFKNMPLTEQNKDAKLLFLDLILSPRAKKLLDRTNLSFTWTPVIGHPHWKPKYLGAFHAIVKGKNPLDHNNVFPENLLKELSKSKKQSKKVIYDYKRDAAWIEDFLLNYCCNNELPEGNRHNVINKNLAILIANREDQDEIIAQYMKFNEGAGSIRGWIVSFHRGAISKISVPEIRRYIDENKIPYDIKENSVALVEETKFDKAIKYFFDKRDLASQFLKVQPMFYDSGKNFWVWNFSTKSWMRKDEIDVCNLVSLNSSADTISSKEKNEILEALKQEGRLKSPKPLERTCVQFRNTIYNVKTGETFESTPEFFTTNPIPWKIGESKETPVIDDLFTSWVGEKYVITLKEIAAYCFLIDYPIHRIFCFLGEGRNGKSKYLGFIQNLVGSSNVSSSELDTLMISRFEMFNLYRKLAVQMGETNFSTMSKTAILKKLSGQDLISFEAKNKDPLTEMNYAKLLISTNNLPETEDKSDGFYRRWLCIDFPNKFPEGRNILDTIPDEEYENFCYASLDILKNLLDRGSFSFEGTVEERQTRYDERSNPFDKFVKENCLEFPDEFIFKHEFKSRFTDWCVSNRFRKPTDIEISNRMKSLHVVEAKNVSDVYDVDRGNYKWYRSWRGIGWKDKGLDKECVESLLPKVEEVRINHAS